MKVRSSYSQFRLSLIFVAILMIGGLLLQLTIGNLNFGLLKSPVNISLGVIIILLIILFSFFRDKALFRCLSGVPFSITIIGTILILSLIMGLIPQTTKTSPANNDIYSILGLRTVTSSWTFLLAYLALLLSLGLVISRRLSHFKISDYAFYLNHFGLWLLLFSASLGTADMQRGMMTIYEGEKALVDDDKTMMLPFQIYLNDFAMETYPPTLILIDVMTGNALPENKPAFFYVDEKNTVGELDNIKIQLLEYIPQAIITSDNNFKSVNMPGASEAVHIHITDKLTGKEIEGWVYRGNSRQPFRALSVDSLRWIMFSQPEPSKFISEIRIENKTGESADYKLMVNKPIKIGGWKIYQYGYDTKAGKNSRYSILGIIYDPWINIVYFGILLLISGSVCMFRKKIRKTNDVE